MTSNTFSSQKINGMQEFLWMQEDKKPLVCSHISEHNIEELQRTSEKTPAFGHL